MTVPPRAPGAIITLRMFALVLIVPAMLFLIAYLTAGDDLFAAFDEGECEALAEAALARAAEDPAEEHLWAAEVFMEAHARGYRCEPMEAPK